MNEDLVVLYAPTIKKNTYAQGFVSIHKIKHEHLRRRRSAEIWRKGPLRLQAQPAHSYVIYPPEILTSKLHLSQDQTIVNFHMVISDHLLLSGIDNGHYKESHQWYQWIGLRDNFNRFEPHFVW